jgi:hypothetical protein
MKQIEQDHVCKFRDELASALGRELRLKKEIERLESFIRYYEAELRYDPHATVFPRTRRNG